MKKMRKIMGCITAAVMALALSLSVNVQAAEKTLTETVPSDESEVTVTKVYKLRNGDTVSPEEIFTLVQEGDGTVTDGEAASAPHLGTVTGASYTLGNATKDGVEKTITIVLPEYERVGVYEYTLKEVIPDRPTAGVIYRSAAIRLVVTVVQGENGKLRIAAVHTEDENGNKNDSFENIYEAGKLNITKTVKGNLADPDRYFEFKVKLTGDSKKLYKESYNITGGSYAQNPDTISVGEEKTVHLKHGETITIPDLPYGVSYTVTETADSKYTTTSENTSGTISSAETTASFTNTRTGTIDMGVNLDNIPYVLAFTVVVLAAGAALFFRKNRKQD